MIGDIRNPGFHINNTGNQTYAIDRRKFFSKGDAINELVTRFGLSKKAATDAIMAADANRDQGGIRCFMIDKKAAVDPQEQEVPQQGQEMPPQQPQAVSGWGSVTPDQAAGELQQAGAVDATMRNMGIAPQASPAPATDLTALSLLAQEDEDMSIIIQFVPAIIKGVDALLRILFVLRTNESQYSEKMGVNVYNSLVSSIRSVLNKTGNIVERLKRLGVMLSGLSQVLSLNDE